MPLPSEVIRPPNRFKGTPEMKEIAEQEAWPDFIEIVDELPKLTALELITWHSGWYMRVGHVNLSRFYMAALRAHAEATSEPA